MISALIAAEGDAMEQRPIEEILGEWRAAERELDGAVTTDDRLAIQMRIAGLMEEHRAGLEARVGEAETLRSQGSLTPH